MKVLTLAVLVLPLSLVLHVNAFVIQTPVPSPTQWRVVDHAPADERVSLTLFLHGEHFGLLADKMAEIALSPNREWLTEDQLKWYVAPSVESAQAVRKFLSEQGGGAYTVWNRFGSTVRVDVDVHAAEQLFNTTLYTYHNTATGQKTIKTTRIVIPPQLSEHVKAVTGINTFHVSRSTRPPLAPVATGTSTTAAVASTNNTTPIISEPRGPSLVHTLPPGCVEANASWACLARYYGLDTYTPLVNSESVAIASFDFWSTETIGKFTENIAPHAKGYVPARLCLEKSPSSSSASDWCWPTTPEEGLEGTMDIEILLALVYPLDLQFYNAGSLDDTGLVQGLIDLPPSSNRPGVVSISWASPESLSAPEVSSAFCEAVQQLVALGTTLIVGSGDNGISQDESWNMTCPPFEPNFMPSCPYVLSAGATMGMQLERAVVTQDSPDVANGWSGGGFSTRFKTPSYQDAAVSGYFSIAEAALRNSKGSFNDEGKGYPDVSSIVKPLDVWDPPPHGRRLINGGASAAAPLWAAVVGLVNSKCKEKKKGRLGWIHPVLYGGQGAQAVNDITVGGSYGCGKTQLGFPCAQGWDPATGLGSPNFEGLVHAFGCD